MIKVENDMLVLDNTFTKEDVKAIDEFVKINVDKERERIMKLLEGYANAECDEYCGYKCECFGKYEAQAFIALIKGENK